MQFRIIFGLGAAAVVSGCATTQSTSSAVDQALARQLAGESQMQGAALDQATKDAAAAPLGSAENPVRASMPVGQRAYLARLRCADGSAPSYQRYGSLGSGVYGNIVDGYAVQCAGEKEREVIMDMYHRGYVETEAVPGFTIVAP